MSRNLAVYFPADVFGKITSQHNMSKGMSGASVRAVTTTNGSYVLRIHHGDHQAWQRSLGIQRRAADNGIAPDLLHVDVERQAAVSRKISGISFGAAVAQPSSRPAALKGLAVALAKLHALPAQGIADANALQFARDVWASQVQRPGFPAWAAPLTTQLAMLSAELATDDRLVLSHGDLNPANILWDGTRVWLIDWDSAGLSHPYLDMATIANFLGLPDEVAIDLLALQEQSAIDPPQQELFKAWRKLSRMVYGAVFLRLIPDLTEVAFASPDITPTLSQCLARMASGQLDMGTKVGQALIGAAFFKQCV